MPEDTSPPITPLAEINLGPSKFEQFLENNQKLLTVLLGLLVVASAAYIVIRGVEKSREQTAGAALSKAVGPTALKEVIDQHANTKASASAKLLLADVQISDGKTDDAMQTLRDFIANHPNHAAIPTASAKLAAQLMSQGKSAEASTIFQDIVADPSARYIAPYALICLGDIAKAGGDPAKAETHFKQIQTEFPESSFATIAADRLASVYTKAPVEVEPPPPAPAEPETKPATSPAKTKEPEKKSAPKPATKSSSKSTKTAPKSTKAKN